MYSQTFLVTSVRAIFLPPQTAARASESCFGAKIPRPFFFMAALVSVVFFVVTVVGATVVFVVVVFVNFT